MIDFIKNSRVLSAGNQAKFSQNQDFVIKRTLKSVAMLNLLLYRLVLFQIGTA